MSKLWCYCNHPGLEIWLRVTIKGVQSYGFTLTVLELDVPQRQMVLPFMLQTKKHSKKWITLVVLQKDKMLMHAQQTLTISTVDSVSLSLISDIHMVPCKILNLPITHSTWILTIESLQLQLTYCFSSCVFLLVKGGVFTSANKTLAALL